MQQTITAQQFLLTIGRAQSGSDSCKACEFKDLRIVGDISFSNIHIKNLLLENVTLEGEVSGIITVDTLKVHSPMCLYFSSLPALYAGRLIKDFTKDPV